MDCNQKVKCLLWDQKIPKQNSHDLTIGSILISIFYNSKNYKKVGLHPISGTSDRIPSMISKSVRPHYILRALSYLGPIQFMVPNMPWYDQWWIHELIWRLRIRETNKTPQESQIWATAIEGWPSSSRYLQRSYPPLLLRHQPSGFKSSLLTSE